MARYVVKDTFYKKAKKEGYRARSAYKLQEIQEKFHAVKKGDSVLDLGAAPGSWVQILADLVGENGLVAGLDVLPVPAFNRKNVITRTADIRGVDIAALLEELSLPAFDVVTCDIAPNLTGIRDVDRANIEELYLAVVGIVRQGLKRGGNFLFKSFFLEDFKKTVDELNSIFGRVTIYKPAASRSVSSEVYLVCSGKKS